MPYSNSNMAPEVRKYSFIGNYFVGIAIMVVLFLIGFGSFRCKRCQGLKPYHYYYNPTTLTQDDYEMEILGHRNFNSYLNRQVYNFDYATRVLYPDSLMTDLTELMSKELFGNTHSESQSSERSTDAVEDLRRDILTFLGTSLSNYTVVFTHSNGQAMKTLIESIPFNSSSSFFFSSSSHNDLLGLRNYAIEKGATVKSFKMDSINTEIQNLSKTGPNLAAFPLVDLFDGTVVTPEQINQILSLNNEEHEMMTLADISHYLTIHPVNLTETPFTAVTFSFEHLFGYPQLGVLVMKNSMIDFLQKPYFSGGTLVYALPSEDVVKMRLRPSERFEDGSLPFLNIIAVSSGFKLMETLKWSNVRSHINNMTQKVLHSLNTYGNYSDGTKGVVIYGTNQESIVSFNILDKKGNVLPYQKYFEIAQRNNIRIAAGCHGTPGTCYSAMNVDENALYNDVENVNMSNYGSLRVSVGWATIEREINMFNELIKFYFKEENDQESKSKLL